MKAALRPHLLPYAGLLALLVLTALGAYAPLGWKNLPLSLLIGSLKTATVALYFMELKKSETLIRLAACAGLVWLAIFLMLALTDYFTRFPGGLLK